MVMPVVTKIYRPIKRSLAIPAGMVGALVVGLSTTAAEPGTLESQPTVPATSAAVEQAVADAPIGLSLNLGDILENVFRYVQVSTISDQEEVQLGQEINRMLLSQQYRLYNDSQVQRYVEQLGQQLVAASDSRDIPYNFQVVVSDNVNAFAVPGGYIYVTTGLLRAVDNEAELASVLSHEIAHINQRHSIKALKQAVLAQGIAETAGVDMNTLAQIGYQLAINLPRSREFEYDADARGLTIMQAAGYPPQAFVSFLEQLMDAPVPPEFLRTHPTSANRIEAIQSQFNASSNTSQQGMSQRNYENEIFPLN
jgi:predicted Zn-dependent protease